MNISDCTRRKLRALFDEFYTEERRPGGGLPLTFDEHLRAFSRLERGGQIRVDDLAQAFDSDYARRVVLLLAEDKTSQN